MKNYIIEACNAIAGTDLRPCIKQSVYAMLVTADGQEFFASNWMSCNELTVCPRVTAGSISGKDYEFCTTMCNQKFHAEAGAVQACELAHVSTVGATVYLTGHTFCCDGCIARMTNAGVKTAIVLDNNKVYNF